MELFTLGIDLGKTTFHLAGMNQRVLSAFGSQKLGGILAKVSKKEPDDSRGTYPDRKGNTCHR
jgi:hypothetical protein